MSITVGEVQLEDLGGTTPAVEFTVLLSFLLVPKECDFDAVL